MLLAKERACDDVAGDDEDVDANKAAGQPRHVRVEDDDGEDGDGAEAVNVWAIV